MEMTCHPDRDFDVTFYFPCAYRCNVRSLLINLHSDSSPLHRGPLGTLLHRNMKWFLKPLWNDLCWSCVMNQIQNKLSSWMFFTIPFLTCWKKIVTNIFKQYHLERDRCSVIRWNRFTLKTFLFETLFSP